MWDRLVDWWRQFGPALRLGARGERLAARIYRRLGYRVWGLNIVVPGGELDLVVYRRRRQGPEVVFVEVKTRTRTDHGAPWEAVGPDKQRRIARAAALFLQRHRVKNAAVRFDVVGITWPADGKAPQVERFEAAFEPC